MVIVLVPALVGGMMAIHRYYRRVHEQVASMPPGTELPRLGPAVVPVRRWDRAALDAVAYAKALRGTAIALLPSDVAPPSEVPAACELRTVAGRGIDPLLREIDAIRHAPDAGVLTIVLPDEPLPLAAQVVLRPALVRLKLELLWRRNVVAASCPRFGDMPVEGPRVAFVPIAGVDAVNVAALGYARALGHEVVAIHVVTDVEHVAHDEPDEVPDEFRRWAAELDGRRPRLVVVESPYRAVVPPVLAYVMQWRTRHPRHVCTVVIPELVDRRLWTAWLHNHRAFWLKTALLRQPGIGVADVTLHLRDTY